VDLTIVEWEGLQIVGRRSAGPHRIASLVGWDERPEGRAQRMQRPNGHGEFVGPIWSTGRMVIVSGLFHDPARRDELLLDLDATLVYAPDGVAVRDLTITRAGRTLTARAQLAGFRPTEDNWGAGRFGWAAQWVCADPFRYGEPITASTGLPGETGGLEFDLFTDGTTDVGYLDFGPPGASGRVGLANPGTAEARPALMVTGSLPAGFELIETIAGSRLRYEGPVGPGQTLTLDSATGRVRLDGADRGGLLTRREWWGVPARGQREVLFTTLGAHSDDADLSVTYRPTYW
jgi:hypothetical protein